jgi:adenine phosphoribosyltransferase
MLSTKLSERIRVVPDFPKPGIQFRDITPVLQDPELCFEMAGVMAESLNGTRIDAVAGIESRGFFFGLLIAQQLKLPFVPVRKEGKLPFKKVRQQYELEYGFATIELHEDAFDRGARVLIHDDLLATGGTAAAAAQMITGMGGEVAAFSFIVTLTQLGGEAKLNPFSDKILSLVNY